MPMSLHWDNDDKTIIRIETEGRYTWDEYNLVMDEFFNRVDTHDSVFGVIAVRSANAQVPPGNASPHYTRTTRRFEERPQLYLVNVKQETYVKTLTQMYARNFKMTDKVFTAATVEEARAILEQVRARLSDNDDTLTHSE
mgnify:CR=1 FL=1